MNKYFVIVSFIAGPSFGQVKNVAESIRIKHNIPEIAYAVVSTDAVIESAVLGYHTTGTTDEKAKAKSSDYFHLGSNTKAITRYSGALSFLTFSLSLKVKANLPITI